MFNLFTKSSLALLAVCSSFMAWDSCDPCDPWDNTRAYIGGFGGGLYSDSTKITQMGTAFFTEAQGGPLAVNAQGKTKKHLPGSVASKSVMNGQTLGLPLV